ncbi:esterase [Thozetella sp. PMI_491]|nr:esterase [Thozetella sp. PMI_491]
MVEKKLQVRLPGGSIIGLQKDAVFHARGIRYAEAKRFETPKLVESWEQPMDGTAPASISPQRASRLNSVTGDIVQGRQMDENCQHLTIAAPVDAVEKTAKLPVLVWFHGGACISGGGDLDCYAPLALAKRGMVVVTVTHRLGILGFLPMDGVAPANLGLLDTIMALRWVQKNIAGVGGDPSRVTAGGQSAGAYYIYCMMVGDDTDGLFQRAILQSTPFGWPTMTPAIADRLSRTAIASFKNNPRTASVEELLDVQTQVLLEGKRLGLATSFWPYIGQYPVPDLAETTRRLQMVAGKYSILVGWTQDEGTPFVPMMQWYPTWVKLPFLGSIWTRVMNWWYSQSAFIWPSQRFHDQYRRAGGSSSTYCFRWSPPGSSLGAAHCIDLPFLFGSWHSWKDAPMLRGADTQEVIERLGEQIQRLWLAFASGEEFLSQSFNINENFQF